jgi:NADPH2:quinone reductase
MRAWQLEQLGEPGDVLKLVEVAEPVPSDDQVLIEIEAVGLKFPDILQIQGRYQIKPPLPFIPGGEIAGSVTEIGPGVEQWRPGDRVLWMGGGGLAPRVCAPADQLLPIPDSMPATQAAAMLINYGTGVFALEERAGLRPGETVLVTAAAGGVGTAAVQLAKAMGATVYGMAGGAAKVATVEAVGADKAFDYRRVDIVEAIREVTDGRGVDVVYEAVGGDVFDQVRRIVAWDGRLLVIGFTSGRIPDAPANHVLLKNYSIVGVHWGAQLAREPGALRRHWDRIVQLHQTGHIDPLIFAVRPLEDALESLEAIGNRETVGKIIIEPSR